MIRKTEKLSVRVRWLLLIVLALSANAREGTAQQSGAVTAEIQTIPVQGNVYLLAGAGGNITVQVGDDSVLVVDTGVDRMSDQVLAAIRKVSRKPIRFIVNTHFHQDHTAGNQNISKAGSSVSGFNSSGSAVLGEDALKSAPIIAHENVLKRLSDPGTGRAPAPFASWPTEVYLTPVLEFFNGEAIQIFHEPAAHTDGDSIVFFRRSDVISAGDIFSTVGYPVIDQENGGSINGIINGLDQILDLAVPKAAEEGGTYVIPGHGRICDEADVVEYRDMLVIIRDRIEDLIKQGRSLAHVKEAKPTYDYDGRYGSASGSWTTNMFIEAVYRDLTAKK